MIGSLCLIVLGIVNYIRAGKDIASGHQKYAKFSKIFGIACIALGVVLLIALLAVRSSYWFFCCI